MRALQESKRSARSSRAKDERAHFFKISPASATMHRTSCIAIPASAIRASLLFFATPFLAFLSLGSTTSPSLSHSLSLSLSTSFLSTTAFPPSCLLTPLTILFPTRCETLVISLSCSVVERRRKGCSIRETRVWTPVGSLGMGAEVLAC